MAYIAPFKGVRFNQNKVGSLDKVVTPPYDVINKESENGFIASNPYSMINLDLTKDPGKSKATSSRYQNAADLFSDWLKEGVLLRDDEDAIYLYDVEYTHPSGKRLTRKGMVCLVGLAEFSEGIVKPHEQTFETVIEDRLKLMEVCKAQFSQIFSLYSDVENTVIKRLEVDRGECLGSITDSDGCIHTIWRVDNKDAVLDVQKFFKDRSVYIADGHHRYTTALGYRNILQNNGQDVASDDPANHIMMYLCPMEDEGLSVLPTHRLVSMPGNHIVEDLLDRLCEGFEVEEVVGGSREVLMAEVLSKMDEIENNNTERRTAFGFYLPREDRCFFLTLNAQAVESLGATPTSLKELDVVVLSKLIIEIYLGLDHDTCEQGNLVGYYSDADEAIDVAVKESLRDLESTQLLFLMNATLVKQVEKVADQNLNMPHKSTYFYPKAITGLLLNQLVDGEKINRL